MPETFLSIRIEVRPDGVATLTFGGESRASGRALGELASALDRVLGDVFVRAVVLASDNEDVWLETDVDELHALETRAAAAQLVDTRHGLASRLGRADKPVVCAVHGLAEGVGAEIALGGRARVLSDDARTTVALSDGRFGLAPSMHALQRLADLVGFEHALQLATAGAGLSGSRAVDAGLAFTRAPRSRLVEAAADWAARLAHVGQPSPPRHARARFGTSRLAKSYFMERAKRAHVMAQGRDAAAQAKTVAILDAYARRGLEASYGVERDAFVELAVASGTHRSIDVFLEAKTIHRDNVAYVRSSTKEREPDADVARPSRSVEVTIASAKGEAPSPLEACLHEIAADDTADPADVARAMNEGLATGASVIMVQGGRGGFIRRVRAAYFDEACRLVTSGSAIDFVDRALVEWGFPVGPFALLDAVGSASALAITEALARELGERFTPPAFLSALGTNDATPGMRRPLYRPGRTSESDRWVAKLLGPRAIAGEVDETVYGRVGLPKPSPFDRPVVLREEVQMRVALRLVNEALHCFGEGVVASARDANVASVVGLGFPAFRGGVLRYVDTIGADELLARLDAFRRHVGARFDPAPVLVDLASQRARLMPKRDERLRASSART